MIAWKGVTAVAALLTQAALIACDDSTIALGPEVTVTGVHMAVSTSETWGTRKLMIVGEEGSFVSVSCSYSHGRGGACDPEPSFVSSAPAIVSVHPSGARATLRAHAPGMAVITARVANITSNITIHVVSDPLPIDDLWVSLTQPAHWCPACQVSYDPTGRLETILMPISGALPFNMRATREGEHVTLRSELASTDEGVAYPSKDCRPRALDPDCGVHSPNWVSALSPGTATVSVTAVNLTVSFGVEVTVTLNSN